MKRFVILFMMLCLIVSTVAIMSCGGNDTDTNTDTNSDTNSSVDTNTDTDDANKEISYVITVKDQEGTVVSNAKITIVDGNDNQIATLTTDENGQANITLANGTYYANVTDLPEYHLCEDMIAMDTSDFLIEVINNTPNGTPSRPYPVDEETEIKLDANATVYYIIYGGDRNFLIENANDLIVTYGSDEPREADEENKISFKMPPTDASSRAVIVKFENKASEEKTYTLSIFSDKGAFDNPFDVVLGQSEKVTVATEQIVYFKYIAEKDGMVVVYSESVANSIYFYNTTKMTVSSNTMGSKCEYIYANKGDEVMVYVSSNGENNYNKVEFTVNQYEGTEEDPIPLYKNESSFMLQANQSLSFQVKLEGTFDVTVEGFNIKVSATEEILPDEDGVISGITKNTYSSKYQRKRQRRYFHILLRSWNTGFRIIT